MLRFQEPSGDPHIREHALNPKKGDFGNTCGSASTVLKSSENYKPWDC